MITVLLAEDNDSVAASIRRYLEHSKFAVLHAKDGETAVQTTIEKKPDLILMDIQLPVIDGLEAIKRIRAVPEAEVARIPIIATTGLGESDESARCLIAGADRYIAKPYRIQNLVDQILELCPE